MDHVTNPARDIDFDSEYGFRIGIEAEFVLPYNKGKWSLFAEPTYQHFKSTTEIESQSASVDYKSIEFPLGVRHYMFLNDSSSIFLNGAYIFDFNLNSIIDYSATLSDLDIDSSGNFAFGAGFSYKSKYSIEVRYSYDRDLLYRNNTSSSSYNTLSIIFGYTIL